MLKRLEIDDFQIHKKSVFDFHLGVNSIMGDTGAGKSAVKRAIQLVSHNRPSGEGFIRWGQSQFRMEIKTVEGQVIERIKGEKGKGINRYVLNGESLEAVNRGVPERVRKALNLEDINYQGQFSRFFLLLDSPGDVAKYFNKIVGLEDIDISLANLKSANDKVNDKLKFVKGELEKEKKEAEQYVFLDKIEPILIQLEKEKKEFDLLEEEITDIANYIFELEKIDKELKKIVDFPDVSNILMCIREYEQKNLGYVNFLALNASFESVKQSLKAVKDYPDLSTILEKISDWKNVKRDIDRLSEFSNTIAEVNGKLNILVVLPDTSILLTKISEWEILNEAFKNITRQYTFIGNCNTQLKTIDLELVSLDAEYSKLSKIVCPTCGRPFTNEDCPHR